MNAAIETLRKILQLESQKGFQNNCVVGGLDKAGPMWRQQAAQAALPAGFVGTLATGLANYPSLPEGRRPQAVAEMLAQLELLAAGVPVAKPPAATQLRPATQHGTKQPEHQSTNKKQRTPPAERDRPAVQRPVPAAAAVPTEPDPNMHLDSPLTVIPGVGPKFAEVLAKLGLSRLGDTLHYFPHRYLDYSALKPINRIEYGDQATIIGTVREVSGRKVKGGQLHMVRAVIGDSTGEIECTWFNQPWLQDQLRTSLQIQVSGRVDLQLGRLVLSSPDWDEVDSEALHTGRIVPIYNLTKGLGGKQLRRWMHSAVYGVAPRVSDPLPAPLREKLQMQSLPAALAAAHFPQNQQQLDAARQRLAFDELFALQLNLRQQRAEWQAQPGHALAEPAGWLASAIGTLAFPLTAAQQRVLADLLADMAQPVPMKRLIQGDVGSGKTVVAALALALAVRNGVQGAIMAPTSILAEQHFRTMRTLLAAFPQLDLGGADMPAVRLLQGSTPATERAAIDEGLRTGTVKVLVGTHAVIQAQVHFAKLGLVVVDEQHRFGVLQRAALREKGMHPHLLVMTATPIPRSLALTIYGDLDLSVIDEMPPGRQQVQTHVVPPKERERAYGLVRKEVAGGHQAYIICPLVEDSDSPDTKAVVEEHERLQRSVFPELRLGLLHGRLRPAEKDAIMQAFRAGEIQILVATSVIEVGVDVPNATIMLIEGANRFGLAQMHQLRGRVGRGADQSYCLLLPEPGSAGAAAARNNSNERLKIMESTSDGFVLADKDLAMRGPGDFLGTQQAGFVDLQMARLSDLKLIEMARREADLLFKQDPLLTLPEHQQLAALVAQSAATASGDVS